MRPNREQLLRIAASHWAACDGEDGEARLALAWLARNLIERERASPFDCGARLLGLAPESAFAGLMKKELCRAGIGRSLALLGEVFDGAHADPTGGAVRAHRHDENPAWAYRASPLALIGPWLFYRAADR